MSLFARSFAFRRFRVNFPAWVLGMLLVAACRQFALGQPELAPPPIPPPGESVAPQPPPPPPADPSPLAGKRICIDPGHGGKESGAVGVGGLREADVNLRVCLMLRERLVKAGATVFMTREDDSNVSLMDRPRFNKKHQTDLFVSIHHNANAQADRTSNRSESFYHWNDDGGPSEDAARLLDRAFLAAFRLPGSKPYVCWAYGVLRENTYPAILGEASYISNPEEEARLRKDEYLALEADAYFQAIESFFRGGRPEITLVPKHDTARRRVVQAIAHQRDALSLLDPQRIRIELDGKPLDHDFFYRADFGILFSQLPTGDLSGTHTLTLAVRNLAGHTSTVQRKELFFENPWIPPAPPPHARFGTATILGIPRPGADPVPLPGAELFGQQIRDVYARADVNGVVALNAVERITPDPHIVRAFGYWAAEVDLVKHNRAVLQPIYRGVLHGKRIVVDAEGGGDVTGPIGPTGLRAPDVNLDTALYLAAYLRRAGADVSLTRTADVGMDNVARVRFGLERNPDIFLTIGHRLPEPGMNERPGVKVTRIGHRWDGGGAVAKSLIFHLRHLLGTSPDAAGRMNPQPLPGEIHNWSSWEVMHGAQEYTALHVCPIQFDTPEAEPRLSTTAARRKQALALLYGLADYFGEGNLGKASIEGLVLDAETQAPIGDALVWINDTLIAQTESDGIFHFKHLEAGAHSIRILARGHTLIKKDYDLKEAEALRVRIDCTPGPTIFIRNSQ